MLEQYGFVKSLLNISSEKVKESAFFSAVINFIIAAMGYLTYFAQNMLGVSVAFVVMLAIIMSIDSSTGIKAAKVKKDAICSKKGLRGVFKFLSYIVFMYVMNQLSEEANSKGIEWIAYCLNLIKMFLLITICFWELKSIDENSETLGYNFRIFNMLDPIYNAIKNVFKDNTHIDMGDGEE